MRPQDKSRTGRAVKADRPISKRGWPVPSEHVPGADWKAGTPSYIRKATDAAEAKAKRIVGDFGGGKQGDDARHRVSEPGKGKPETKRDAQFHNPVKQTPC